MIRFLDIQKSNYGYPKIQSLQNAEDTRLNTLKCSRFLDILKSNYGYPKLELWISEIQHDFWISKHGFRIY